ncbi:MAG: DNA repair protein RecN [Myxococcales bacterium]|nr:DNA repair protein RecN [Myxococcales bacterium]
MIETLRIRDVAIVDEVALEFGPGLNVLTGETGAGKSIVLGALSLLAGARASADLVRDGAERAEAEAVFRTAALGDLERELEALGLGAAAEGEAWEHELIVQRSVERAGRSRARVGGALLPVTALARLFEGRIEISSQHSSQALLHGETHARLLDEAGGHGALRDEVERGCAALRELDRELVALREAAEDRARREDFLRFQIEEIDAAGLRVDEVAELEADHRRLAHAEQLREEGAIAVAALAGDASAADADAAGAVDLVARAQRVVASLAKMDGDLEALGERLRASEDELRDVAADLERYVDRLDVDPRRLARLEERIGEVEKLRRKYGDDVARILAFREAAAAELAGIEGADERVAALERERAASGARLANAASALSAARERAAKALARRVQAPLRDLALPDARFEVALRPIDPPDGLPCGPSGREAVEFLFAANAGSAPRPLQKVASGGELSRVFLAVKNALRGAGRGMVLVFDEVDAGIGGRVAERVGRCLAELAAHHQVLCITHHPQIAALADRHFRVAKRKSGRRTLATVERVEGEARVDEIARMAGGEAISPETRRHAEALLRGREA